MAGSTFGTLFRVTSWGESHGKALGVVVDGCPAGLPLSEEDIQVYLDRRKPGRSRYATARSEGDRAQILSGVFEGKTTGTPISILVSNEDQHSKDYSNIADIYRPGHADLGFDKKYGFRDYRGGGRSSGRETIGRVAAGAIACRILALKGIRVTAYTKAIGPVSCDPARFDADYLKESTLCMPDREAEERAQAYLNRCMEEKDSSGGIVECVITGMPQGIGEPVFDKLDALLGQAMFSIGAVKGVEIGAGFQAAGMRGSENNDQYMYPDSPGNGPSTPDRYHPDTGSQENSGRSGSDVQHSDNENAPMKMSNHAGGILGGMSDGTEIVLRAAFKPTPSIARPQSALASDGSVRMIEIRGRHDPVIVPRAVVVVECMAAITVLDLLMRDLSSRLDW
jgi:chorismate synthase